MIRIARIDDLDEAREIHSLAFPEDPWPGDDNVFWVARDETGVVGFCSALHSEKQDVVFLTRAAVVVDAQGYGLQRRLIQVRVRWARRLKVRSVLTYTLNRNYRSMVNLLKCGFRFYWPNEPWGGPTAHYFRLDLDGVQDDGA